MLLLIRGNLIVDGQMTGMSDDNRLCKKPQRHSYQPHEQQNKNKIEKLNENEVQQLTGLHR